MFARLKAEIAPHARAFPARHQRAARLQSVHAAPRRLSRRARRPEAKQLAQAVYVHHRPQATGLEQHVRVVGEGHAAVRGSVEHAPLAHAVAAEDERVRVAVEYRRQHRPLDVFNVVLAPARVSRQHDARKRALLAHQPQFLRQLGGVAHPPQRAGHHPAARGRVARRKRVAALFDVRRLADAARLHPGLFVENAQQFHRRSPFASLGRAPRGVPAMV